MASRRKTSESDSASVRRPPPTTPEAQENRLIAKSLALVERQIEDGSVSSQVLAHFVRQSSPREKLEREKLVNDNEMLRKKITDLESAIRVEALYEDALNAMRSYAGQEPVQTYDD